MASPDAESVSWMRFLLASVTILGLMAALGFVLKYVSMRGWLVPRPKAGRLTVMTTLPLDARRRLVIAKCDMREYLLLLGPNNDLLLAQSDADESLPSPVSQNTRHKIPS